MGEYATHPTNGRRIKLGTCENLYYVTRADIEALASKGWRGDGGNADLRTYLRKPFRTRLDRLDATPGDPGIIEAREPWSVTSGYRVRASDRVMDLVRTKVEHGSVYHHKHSCNLIIPCPCGKEWGKPMRHSGYTNELVIVAEGMDPRRLVFLCPFCEWPFNLHGHAEMGDIVDTLETSKPLNGVPDRFLASLIALARAGLPEVEPAAA